MAWIVTGLWVLASAWWVFVQVRAAREDAARERLQREWAVLE